ncbi:MAG: ABC transporter ATP-binding protein, partial [candidate division Zixibacteria bacterium]|nr:ABC transporter ATP-binding protein [Phycisphaerae bacterium]NIR65976.1 ABC transporter ATP-binding protein [candidate division Zixibacteria bacterium]NIX00899.1 ABC transporter ATP-binding protein [Phycisphaerae bacterium]
QSAYKIADRIAMLYQGAIIEEGTPEEIRNTENPVVRQFITGSATGPINIEGIHA